MGIWRNDDADDHESTTQDASALSGVSAPPRLKGRGLASGSPDADQSRSRKGLRCARMHRHRGVTFQPHALRLVVKQVDWEGSCCQHETSRNVDEEDLTRASGGSWVALHTKSHPPHGDSTESEVRLRADGVSSPRLERRGYLHHDF